MVSLKKISVNELPELVKIAFTGDKDLCEKYYEFRINEIGCINTTLMKIYEMRKRRKLDYYKVVYAKKPIGYVVAFDNFLYSFGIEMGSRKKEILVNWWNTITKVMPKQFATMLYAHNERAINFLKRNGMVLTDNDQENNVVTLVKQ